MDLTDPMGLELQVLLLRDDFVIGPGEKRADVARRQPGTYTIYDNGKLVFVGRANETGFQKNVEGKLTMGVKAGTYKLLPKGDSWGLATQTHNLLLLALPQVSGQASPMVHMGLRQRFIKLPLLTTVRIRVPALPHRHLRLKPHAD
jgi:hypothetical protein